MPKFLKKLLKILAILSVVCIAFLGFVYVKYSNFDGYCEEVGKILTEEELLRKVVGKIYEEDPYCCYVVPVNWLVDDINSFLNSLFGYYDYEMHLYYKRKIPLTYDFNDPYYESYVDLDKCGHVLDTRGITMSEKSYNAAINSRKKHYIMKGEKQ